MKTSPQQLDESLHIARQIAEALEYAHERGVIHRDLKPANVKIAPEGMAKVLDFGLAKLADDTVTSADPSSSPTLTAQATQAGAADARSASRTFFVPDPAKHQLRLGSDNTPVGRNRVQWLLAHKPLVVSTSCKDHIHQCFRIVTPKAIQVPEPTIWVR